MNNFKKGLVSLISTLTFVNLISLVSAYTPGTVSRGPEDFVQIVIDFLGPFFAAILGYENVDQYFFARILLLIIVFIISALALEGLEIFKGNKVVVYIIAAAVAILGARYMTELNFVRDVLLPYQAVSIFLMVFLPFFIVFFFIHKSISSSAGRRTAWVLFAVIFVGLWWTRQEDVNLPGSLRWIYNIGIWIVLATVVFDRKIHEYFGLAEADKARRDLIKQKLADVEEALNRYSAITNPSKSTKEVIEKLEERRNELAKKI